MRAASKATEPAMSGDEYTTVVQDEQASMHPIAGRHSRSGTDTVLRMDRARVLICDPIPAEAVERMRAGGLRVDERVGLSPEQFEALVGGYDAVVVRSATRLGEQQIAAARRLRLIVRGGAGTDNIDLAAAASREIAVLNTPNASTVSVVELTLGLLFALARRIPQADAALKSGRWAKKELLDGIELEGKTLGIIGVGRIGGALGRCASALGMVVVGTDKELEPSGRGLYAGTVGYLDFAGNLDFCIAIRTIIMSKGKAYVQAGAGIVIDSNPTAEYEETRDKARALMTALELAQQGL